MCYDIIKTEGGGTESTKERYRDTSIQILKPYLSCNYTL